MMRAYVALSSMSHVNPTPPLSLFLAVLNQAKSFFPLVCVQTGCASLQFIVFFHCEKHRGWPSALETSIGNTFIRALIIQYLEQ